MTYRYGQESCTASSGGRGIWSQGKAFGREIDPKHHLLLHNRNFGVIPLEEQSSPPQVKEAGKRGHAYTVTIITFQMCVKIFKNKRQTSTVSLFLIIVCHFF